MRVCMLIVGLICTLSQVITAYNLGRPYVSRCTHCVCKRGLRLYGVVRRSYVDNSDGDVNNDPPTAKKDTEQDLESNLREMFPLPGTISSTEARRYKREEPNWLELDVDDPMWLDMDWPTEASPEASAYARHLQWKRALPDGERVRWQKWAIYDRLQKKGKYEYAVEDFVRQDMVRTISNMALNYHENDRNLEANLWNTIAVGFEEDDKEEIKAVIESFYSAFNRKNFDEMRVLLLPSAETSCKLPGHGRVSGVGKAHQTYRRVLTTTKPLATVRPEVVGITTSGFVAVAHVMENVEPGRLGGDLKGVGNRQQQQQAARNKMLSGSTPSTNNNAGKPFRRFHSTLVLRKFNQQWRIVVHETAPVKTSDYIGERTRAKSRTKAGYARGMFRDAIGKLLKGSGAVEKGSASDLGSARDEIARALAKKGLPSELARMLADSASKSISSGKGSPDVKQFNTGGLNGFIIKGPGAVIDSEGEAGPGGTEDDIPQEERVRIGPDGRSVVPYIDVEGSNKMAAKSAHPPDVREGLPRPPQPQPLPIDTDDDTSQQTLQALRLLVRSGLIKKEAKDRLTLDMIECMTEGQPSMTEKAYRMLVHNRLDGPQTTLTKDGVVDDVLEEFSEQCNLIADILVTRSEEEEDGTREVQDENEEEALISALAGSLKASGDVELGDDGDENEGDKEAADDDNDEDDDEDDEEAVIAALAGSLSPR